MSLGWVSSSQIRSIWLRTTLEAHRLQIQHISTYLRSLSAFFVSLSTVILFAYGNSVNVPSASVFNTILEQFATADDQAFHNLYYFCLADPTCDNDDESVRLWQPEKHPSCLIELALGARKLSPRITEATPCRSLFNVLPTGLSTTNFSTLEH